MTKIILNGVVKNNIVNLKIEDYLKKINIDINNFSLDSYEDIIYLLSIIHVKSCEYFFRNKEKDNLLYEELSFKIDHLFKYYLDLQDYLEQKEFLSPGEYLLILNISNFYELFRKSKYYLDLWFSTDELLDKDSLLIGKVGLRNNNFKINNYLRGSVVFDLVSLIKNEFNNLDVIKLYKYYKRHNTITFKDELLLFSLLGIVEEFKFSKNNYVDTINVRKLTEEVLFILEFMSKEDKENKKTN